MKRRPSAALVAKCLAAVASTSPPLLRRLLSRTPLQDLALEWAASGSPSEEGSPLARRDVQARFLLRVDDFPAHDLPSSAFLEFHHILSDCEVPYLLGVTPHLAADPLDSGGKAVHGLSEDDASILRHICSEGVDLALHGFTHRMRGPNIRSELFGVPEAELRHLLEQSLRVFTKHGLPEPIAFIPPFNAVDRRCARIISEYVSILCGGPESIGFLGFSACPDVVEGMAYWPSFYPAYGSARSVSNYVRKVSQRLDGYLIPITVHWRWEKSDEFRGVRELATSLTHRVDRWGDCLGHTNTRKEVGHGLSIDGQ